MPKQNERNEYKEPAPIGLISVVTLVLIIFVVLFAFIFLVKIVPAGHRGVLYKAESGISTEELSEGWHIIRPFVWKVSSYDIRTDTYTMSQTLGEGEKVDDDRIVADSEEGLKVGFDVSVRFTPRDDQIAEIIKYKKTDYKEQVIRPIIRSCVRTVAAKHRVVAGGTDVTNFDTIKIIEDRPLLEIEMKDCMQEKLKDESDMYDDLQEDFITVNSVLLRNINLPDVIVNAISIKKEREQKAQEQEYNLRIALKEKEIQIVNAEKQKQAQILVAEGEAEATRKIAYARADGTNAIKKAYSGMPMQYVSVKYAEAIKATDKVYLGFDSLSGDTMSFLNLNDMAGLYSQGQTTGTN